MLRQHAVDSHDEREQTTAELQFALILEPKRAAFQQLEINKHVCAMQGKPKWEFQ